MKTVDVILRTHSTSDVHPGDRVLKAPKQELILGCLRSLIRTIEDVNISKYKIKLTVFDDHSEEVCVEEIKKLISHRSFETEFIPLGTYGVGPSLGASYTYARDCGGDIIYFVEDDYLHCGSALSEMLEAQETFAKNLGMDVAIFPLDYPDNYDPRWARPSRLVIGPKRHWHTDFSTTGTFLIKKTAFMRNIEYCMRLSLYKIDPMVDEANSINQIWAKGGVQLFSPVPTLAIHMQDIGSIPPFIDWQRWWQDYAKK